MIIAGIITTNKFQNPLPDVQTGSTSAIFDTAFDTATIEATVLSIDQMGVERPSDSGRIRIDSISDYVRHPKANYDPLPESVVGTEINLDFLTSARPAKIRCEQLPSKNTTGETTSPRTEETKSPATESEGNGTRAQAIPLENGYLIYTYYTANCPEEIVLPGISERDEIRFSISYSGVFPNIYTYEIMH